MMICPACGAQPWYILRGACQSCGHRVSDRIDRNIEVTL